jgi:arylsulfatase A-like enzyme
MITRRDFLAATSAASLQISRASRAEKPSFILILMDDLGCHDLGCLGAADLKTPNIDELATSGARFTNWYSNAPVCAPARASLMTGRYTARCGVPRNGLSLPPGEQTIAALLKPAGYATGITGKWHLGSDPDTAPNGHGFDYFYGFHSGCVDFYSHRYYWGEPRVVNYHDLWRNRTEIFENGQYLTERITEEAVQFIRSNQARPFFLYVPYNAVHYPMHAPNKYVERFPSLERERQMYAAMLAAADDGVGAIIRTLEQAGIRDNTLVMFAGDNGATTEKRAGLNQQPATAGSNRPFRGFKFSLFDGGMHVPAILNWPGVIPPRQVIHEMAMSVDILPTVCAAAGVKLPTGRTIDGRDVLSVATSGARSPNDAVFWASGKQLAVRRGKWKLVINGIVYDGSPDGNKPLQGDDAMFLSNLEEDPGESRNLRRKYPELVDELATAIYRWGESVTAH